MKEEISEFLEEKGFRKNEHGVYLYKSEDGIHVLNMATILEDFEEYEGKKYQYVSIDNEKNFEGIRIPLGHSNLLRTLNGKTKNWCFFDDFTDNREQFHQIEIEHLQYVEYNSSLGIKILDSIGEFKIWFLERFKDVLTADIIKIIIEYDEKCKVDCNKKE